MTASIYGPDPAAVVLAGVLDVDGRPERSGALQRRVVHVRQPDLQRRHRHVLQLGDHRTTQFHSTQFGGPGAVLNPLACANAPVWIAHGDPASGSLLAFPPANTAIRNQADGALGGTGCLYTGPTTITLKNVGGVGKMDVTSPGTISTNPGCAPGTNRNLPANGVIYVQNVPSSTSDPNHSSCSGTACNGDVQLSGTLERPAHDRVRRTTSSSSGMSCTTSTRAASTCSAWSRTTTSRCTTRSSGSSNGAGSLTDPTIDAAILSLNHSFYVQNWATGAPLGTLTVNGVITQEFRGPVGTFGGTPPADGDRVRQELQLRHAAQVPEPAVLPQPDPVGVGTHLVRRAQTESGAVIIDRLGRGAR